MTPIGIGAWSWGDRSGYWGYGQGYQKADNLDAFKGLVGAGVGLIDTAEVLLTTLSLGLDAVCPLDAPTYAQHRRAHSCTGVQ